LIAERFVTYYKYAANLITLSRLEGPLSLSSSENTLLHCRQFINGRAQPILWTSNTLLKIINKQQAYKSPDKVQNADFRFTERDFCAAQYLNTIANSKTQQCPHI